MKNRIALFFLSIASLGTGFLASGQTPKPAPNNRPPIRQVVVPGYFMFPIQPGGQNSLSGGMGDLRANHFHAGLDIRTGGREGLPVYAAADGYVSRIAVFTGGYGNVIFLKHPNGMTTVYGHLKTLNDTLGTYLRSEQYRKQTFEIDLRPAPGQYPVRKGDIIALSGNTGGSGGPHLHFEIRDERDNLINPLLYNFRELRDEVPPYFERIALRTLTTGSRLNGEYTRQSFAPVRRADGSYGLNQPITASGLIGLEILAYDKTTGSPYRNGINCVEVKLDGREMFTYNMDSFPHEETRFINVHMDYETERLFGQRYHRCYVADGNQLSLYHTDQPHIPARRGRLPLMDGKPHDVTVTLFDSYQNSAVLRFTVQPDSSATDLPLSLKPSNQAEAATITTDQNVLKLAVRNLPDSLPPAARLFEGKKVSEQPVSYVHNNAAVYLIDLNTHLPEAVMVGAGRVATNLKKRVIPGRDETYEDGTVSLNFGAKTLFDTLYLAVRSLPGGGLEINQNTIPLNEPLGVVWNTAGVADTSRTKAYLVDKVGRERYVGGSWQKNKLSFKTRELGRFQLLTDATPPQAQFLSLQPNGISARITDDRSGIRSFRAMVDGQWLLMQYDYKRALLWSDKLNADEPFPDGAEVLLEVTDNAGNVTSVQGVVSVPKPKAKPKAKPTARKKRRR
ncbi:peptidoglycan DD-metalloendopeptidase family protein [Rudanella lutea]|uniref:peptidoglycan DD-metalloendopeptidase family protein n=1 Tax=Rudanella lutea TaxID=451374 RepID=UPI00037FFC4D